MRIFLIILNHNCEESTLRLIDSLRQQTDTDFSVIVIDNASTDPSSLRDSIQGSNFNFIENSQNLGFAGGNNIGIKRAFEQGADWAIILNVGLSHWTRPPYTTFPLSSIGKPARPFSGESFCFA